MYTRNKSPKEVNPKESKKAEKKRTDDISRKHKMMFHLNSNTSLTTLNVNSISTPIKISITVFL